jgi:hypothetical protein
MFSLTRLQEIRGSSYLLMSHLLMHPKPFGEVPTLVSLQVLHDWAIQCSVPPSEVTLKALMTQKTNDSDAQA